MFTAVPGLIDRLASGIDVLDLGCGTGSEIVRLARQFASSRFMGIDSSEDAIAVGERAVRQLGLRNLIFCVADAARLSARSQFDLVLTNDVIRGQRQPTVVIGNILAALRPGGTYVLRESVAPTELRHDIGSPFGTCLHGLSCAHGQAVSYANDGDGPAVRRSQQQIERILWETGFARVTKADFVHDPLHTYFVATRNGGGASGR